MSKVDLDRWQFGITIVYHYIFVPLTIGLAVLVAVMQTAWYLTKDDNYLRMTKFWGKLFLINFAIGVVTGIVQEFQFGMNWSTYSRFVGDIFGAPLAMEGLIAFFLESTFLGLWIFGWDKLSPRMHLATIWLAAIGTNVSAYFILAANSWMQHPVGYRYNPATHRAELHNIWSVLTNEVAIVTIPHTVLAAFLTASTFILGISAWHLLRKNEIAVFKKSAEIALVVGFVAACGTAFVGHAQAQVMTKVQPMKMASAEALWNTQQNASFSFFAIGDVTHGKNKFDITLPDGLSVLATNHTNGTVQGINDVEAAEQAQFGPGNYEPVIPITYWFFRFMVGLGLLLGLLTFIGLVIMWRGKLTTSRRFLRISLWSIGLPLLANSIGWIFTEMGRQPWVVYGLLRTRDAESPNVGAGMVLTTLIGFTLLYGVLAVIEVGLTVRYAKAGPPELTPADEAGVAERPAVSSLVY